MHLSNHGRNEPPSLKPVLNSIRPVFIAFALSVVGIPGVSAQTDNRTPVAKKTAPAADKEQGPRWRELKSSTRQALKPLESVWSGIDADRKLKWIEIAQRMPAMTEDERARMQLRMSEWVMLGPAARSQTRLNFHQAKQLPLEERQNQWQSYRALPEDKKRQLASGLSSRANGAPTINRDEKKGIPVTQHSRAAKAAVSSPKSNITPNPAFSLPPTPVAPTLVHPSYGATTTLVTKVNTPPQHQQVGLPKIISSSRFIDPKTLLPRRGPQAAVPYWSELSEKPLERP